MSHTKGPWKDGTGLLDARLFVDGTGYASWIEANPHNKVALVFGDTTLEVIEKARLIAAAPEMLEVLKQYHDFAPSPESKAIIAKAEGK